MADLEPINHTIGFISGPRALGDARQWSELKQADDLKKSAGTVVSDDTSEEGLISSARAVEKVVNVVVQDTSLSFRVEEDLSRMVVAVRAVGSDEIIRQFPPEEFITVAKHIAAQNPDMIDEDYLKGVLFDQYS